MTHGVAMSARAERQPLDTTTDIETPEHVRFRYHVAGPFRRGLAWLVDLLVRAIVIFILAIFAAMGGLAIGDELGQASAGILLVVMFALEWGYYVFCELIWAGRSPGKRAMNLRVVGDGGLPITFAQSFLRNLLRTADFLPSMYALGLLVMGRDARFRRLGDLAAGTMVIVEERHGVGAPLRIEPPPTARELGSLPQRLPLAGEDLEALELLLRREGLLGPAREHELAEMIAPIYAKRVGASYRDPMRFLKILYARARGMPAAPDPPAWPAQGPGAHPQGWWPQQPGAQGPGYGPPRGGSDWSNGPPPRSPGPYGGPGPGGRFP